MVYQEYIDPTIKNRLKIGIWYYENKEIILKIFLGFLIFLNLLFWIYVFYGITMIILNSEEESGLTEEIIAQRSSVFEIHDSMAPEPLLAQQAQSVPSSGESGNPMETKRADFVCVVENTNPNWVIEVDYFFTWDGGESETYTTMILPLKKAPLYAIGTPVSVLPSSVQINISPRYSRVKADSKVPRALSAVDSLRVDDYTITPGDYFTDVEALLINIGMYSIIEPSFVIVAKDSSERLLGSGVYLAEKIDSQGTLKIQYRWMRGLPKNAYVDVYPVFDFLDDSAYLFKD